MKKPINVLSKAAFGTLIASLGLASPVMAAVDSYLVKADGVVYNYDKAELEASFIADQYGDGDNKLFQNFEGKFSNGFYAFHDDTGKYVNYQDIEDAFLDNPDNFNLDAFTEASDKVPADLPATVKDVAVNNGVIVTTDVNTGDVNPDIAVSSVSAINKTTLKVTFSGEVDGIDSTNVQLGKGNFEAAVLAADKKSATITVTGLNYGETISVTIKGIKAGDTTLPDYTAQVNIPAITDLYKLEVICDAANNTISADGASKTMLTATVKEKSTGNVADVDGIVQFTATKGGLAQPEVALQDGKASVQLTSAASDVSVLSYITATISSAPAAKEYEGITSNFEVTFSPDTVDHGNTTFVSALKAESNQADRFFVTFSDKISAADYRKVVADDPLAYPDFGVLVDGQSVAIKNVVQKADNVLEFILDTDDAGSVAPVTSKVNSTTLAAGPTYFLQDNETHRISIPANVGNLVLQNAGLNFILTDATKPQIFGVNSGADQLHFSVRFSEAMAEDWVETIANGAINDKFLIDGKKVRLNSAATAGDVTAAKAANEIIVKELYVGEHNAVTGEDTRNIVYFTMDSNFKLAGGAHQIQIANVGDWAGMVDPNNRVSTQTFDFTVTVDNSKPVPTMTVQSPEQWLVKFNVPVNTVTGKKVQDAFKIYRADDQNTALAYGTDYVITPVDSNGLATGGAYLAADAINNDTNFLIEFKNDWTQYYNTGGTGDNYFTSAKNPYKVVVSNLENNMANAMDTANLSAVLSYDGTSPTIANATDVYSLNGKSANGLAPVNGYGKQVYVQMSEPVQMTASTPLTPSQQQVNNAGIPVPTFEFVKGDVVVPGTVVVGSVAEDDKSYVVAPNSTLAAGTWTLYIRSISDDVGNTSATTSTTVTVAGEPVSVTDTKVAWAAFDQDGNNDYLYIKFTKVMDASGETGVSRTTNYIFNGVALPTGSQVQRGIEDVTKDWDGVTIVMPRGAFDGNIDVLTDFRSVLNVASNFVAADGEALSGPYELQLDDTASDVGFADNDMVFEASYHNTAASAALKGQAVIGAQAFDTDANGKIDEVVLTLDDAANFAGGEQIKVGGKTFAYAGGTGTDTITFDSISAANEVSGTATETLAVTATNGGLIINTENVVDAAAPVILKADATAGSNKLNLTFSEAVWGNGTAILAGDFSYTDTNTANAGAVASVGTNDSYVTTLELTLDATADAADIGTGKDAIAANATSIYDAAGNDMGTVAKDLE